MNGLHHDADFTVILRQIQTAVKMSLRKYFHLLGYFYNGNQQFLFCKGQCGDNLAGNGRKQRMKITMVVIIIRFRVFCF